MNGTSVPKLRRIRRPFEVSTTITSLATTVGSGIFPDTDWDEIKHRRHALVALIPEHGDLRKFASSIVPRASATACVSVVFPEIG